MPASLCATFARLCRSTREQLDLSQAAVAGASGLSRAHLASIESGRANPSLEVVGRVAAALGIELDLVAKLPVEVGNRQRDQVHARCSAYVQRRLESSGLECVREVEIIDGRFHGWIDLLVFDQASGTLLIIEIKTRLDDIGAIERQLGWYERRAASHARSLGWEVRHVRSWLLCLASAEVDEAVRVNREALQAAFPIRSNAMRALLNGAPNGHRGRGLALIDPSRRRTDWLLASRVDGRRSAAPYRSYADAATRWRLGPAGRGSGPLVGARERLATGIPACTALDRPSMSLPQAVAR